MKFELTSTYKPTGDQPQAIEKLTEGINKGYRNQTLLGVTGSGKTFTVANVIKNTRKPTLVISHNKTLAAQLYQELREFFPNNAVCYFVSYYDYYQPEAYMPATDTYIEKEKERNEVDFARGTYRVRGENIEIYPSYEKRGLRISFSDDSIYKLEFMHPVSADTLENLESLAIYPAKHYVSSEKARILAIESIKKELKERLKYLESQNKTLEAHRLRERTNYDLEMINTLGYCKGIENYSRYFDGRKPGEPPFSLLAHFPKGFRSEER